MADQTTAVVVAAASTTMPLPNVEDGDGSSDSIQSQQATSSAQVVSTPAGEREASQGNAETAVSSVTVAADTNKKETETIASEAKSSDSRKEGEDITNTNNDTKSLHEKEKEFLIDKGVEKVGDMVTFGLYGTVTGIRDVAKALHEDSEKQLAKDMKQASINGDANAADKSKSTVDWRHKGYVAANAWTDGELDIVEEVYKQKKKEWKESHEHPGQQHTENDEKHVDKAENGVSQVVAEEEEDALDTACRFLPECGC